MPINISVDILHSSAIQRDNNVILLVGGTGAGKTTLSTIMCINHNFKWLSNDQVGLSVVNSSIEITQGYDLIDFRHITLSYLQNYLPSSILSVIQDRLPEINTTTSKTSPPFEYSNLLMNRGNIPSKVSHIVFLRIVEGIDSPTNSLDRLNSTWSLMQEIVRLPRGVEIFVRNNHGSMIAASISASPRKGWSETCSFVNFLVDNCHISQCYGNIDQITNHILTITTYT